MFSIRSAKISYLHVLLVPVVLFVLLAGSVSLYSYRNLVAGQGLAAAEQARGIERVSAALLFNQELALLQELVSSTLRLAASGELDEAGGYRVHVKVVNKLAALEEKLPSLRDEVDQAFSNHLTADFADYRNLLVMATDLAAVDPPGALREAYRASLVHLELIKHTQSIAMTVADQAARQNIEQNEKFKEQLKQNLVIGGGIVLVLLGVLLVVIRQINRRLAPLTDALNALAEGNSSPSTLAQVERTSRKRLSLLSEMARATLAFRDTILARERAQFDLGERMKELSCLYDVFRLTEREELDEAGMAGSVVERLPAAMRFPDIAYAWVELVNLSFGRQPESGHPVICRTAGDGQEVRVCVAYGMPLPEGSGEAFLAEEVALLEAIAGRLASALTRRRAILAEREHQALMQALFDGAPYPIEICDVETGRFVRVNEATCRQLGYSQAELLSMTIGETLAGDASVGGVQDLGEIFSAGTRRYEQTHCRRDGQLILAEVTAHAIRENGRSYVAALWRDITAEKAASEQVRKLSTVVEQNPNGVIITDLNGRIEYVNDAFIAHSGFQRDELIGRHPRMFKSGKTPDSTYSEMWSALLEGRIWQGELINRRQNGSEYVEFAIIVPLTGTEGKTTHFVAIKEEITEKKRLADELELHRHHLEQLIVERNGELIAAKEAAEESSRNFKHVLDISPDMISLKDRERRYKVASRAYLKHFGLPSDDVLLGRTAEEVLPPDLARQVHEDEDAQLGSNEDVIQLERWVAVADGQRRLLEIKRCIMRDSRGSFDGFFVLARDITERSLAVKALQQKEEELRLLIQSTSEGIFGVDISGRISFANAAAAALLGHAHPDDLIGLSSHKTMHHSHADGSPYRGADCPIYLATHRNEVFSSDSEVFWRADGTAFPVAYSSVPMTRDGTVIGSVVSFQDITVRNQTKLELENAKEAAEAASRAKSDFLANMSHEIRTPMNAIIGLTHLLKRSISDTRQRDHLSKISGAANHLLNIINDILDLSKIEAGKMQLEFSDFEIESVIDNVCNLIRDKVEAKHLELVVELNALPEMLHGDGLRLGQILLNFAGNAVKFTEKGCIALRSMVVAAEDKGMLVRFEVEDSGIGLNPEQQARLFQAFEQADASTTRKYGGTGLGLAISRRLTELMGGRIGVHSEQGKGSTFWIEIPLGHGRSLKPATMADIDLQRLKVLVVDDLKVARESLAAMLEWQGMEVRAVADGESALQSIIEADHAGAPYDLLLCDWQMPGMDGMDLGRRVSGTPLSKQPLRLLVTGYGDSETRDGLSAAGYFSVLHKPLVPSRLYEAIQGVLKGKRSALSQPVRGEAEARLRQRKGRRVLLVEDNPVNQDVAVELLQMVGLQVDLADNGQIAVNMAEQSNYDLILMDVQMPVMDGIAATALIRSIPAHIETPVLAMTANAFDEDRDRCLAVGMNDHISKPVDPEQLYQVLLRWLPEGAQEIRRGEGVDRPMAGEEIIDDAGICQRCSTVEGLDVVAGLHIAIDRPDLYLRLLRRYVASSDAALLNQALRKSDWLQARHLAHSLKGASATLGAYFMREIAAEIELAMRHPETLGTMDASSLVGLGDKIEAEFNRLVGDLGPLISTSSRTDHDLVDAGAVDMGQVHSVLNNLEALLRADEMAAGSVFRDREKLLRTAFGDAVNELQVQIDGFAYDAALGVLEKLRGNSR